MTTPLLLAGKKPKLPAGDICIWVEDVVSVSGGGCSKEAVDGGAVPGTLPVAAGGHFTAPN